MEVPELKATRKNGTETFRYNDQVIQKAALIDFWRWCCSDLMSNATRGILAEFIVAMAIDRHRSVRSEWDVYDLDTREGIKIEVKSSAYVQSWRQKDFSRIVYNIGSTRAWNSQTSRLDKASKRQADVYVFALLKHLDLETIDPLNLNQWTFFVVSRRTLDKLLPDAKTISLKKLREIDPIECSYKRLNQYIKRVHATA